MVRWISSNCSCGEDCEDLNHMFRKCTAALKINVDGNHRCETCSTTTGGIVCNSEKVWLTGFAVKKGVGSVMGAKLWGILEGLKLT
ncbi:hypothetical protein ACOSQ3_012826 [Xanthoceras sorbifolium]